MDLKLFKQVNRFCVFLTSIKCFRQQYSMQIKRIKFTERPIRKSCLAPDQKDLFGW